MTPKRIQRKRTKGWKMPPNTVYVGRPTLFGNPWSVQWTQKWLDCGQTEAHHTAARWFREWLTNEVTSELEGGFGYKEQRDELLKYLPKLRGKTLACYCAEHQPCHADVLLEFANK